MPISVSHELDEATQTRFLDRFAAAPGAALAYHYPFYLRFLSELAYPGARPRFVVARDATGELEGLLIGLHLKSEELNVWLSLAYFGPNAGALVIADERAPIEAGLLAAAVSDARELGCTSITVYTPLGADPASYRAALASPEFELERVSQVLKLPADPAASVWSQKVRYDVKRAAKLGVQVEPIVDDAQLQELYAIYQDNCGSVGIPQKPREHVERIVRSMGSNGCVLIGRHEGRVVAGLICLFGGGVVSYYLPCTLAAARSLQPGLALLDRAIQLGRQQGCRLVNFESSPDRTGGVWAFKERCGGEPTPFWLFVKLLQPGALDHYRRLGTARIRQLAPQAFVVPFSAIDGQ